MELVITILPYSCSTMYFCAALEHKKLPFRWTSSTLSQSSSLILNERLSRKSPALLTRMSMRPKRCAISSNAFSTCCALDTSQAMAIASAPAASTASTVSWQASAERSKTATFAPSCARRMASAAPMPRAAPVTTAVRPSSLKLVHLSVAKHYNPHPERCGLCYMILNCIRIEPMCPEQIGTSFDAFQHFRRCLVSEAPLSRAYQLLEPFREANE